MTERLYYDDAYLTRFQARIVERGCDGCEVYLDRTAFYPTSGGQPYDTGEINGVPVIDVIEDGERIQHRIARPVNAEEVECAIDWPRRFDHMQQHSGQHVLSAVLVKLFDAPTVGFHIGRDVSTIDAGASSLDTQQVRDVEQRANELVFENRPISVAYEQSSEAKDLRKPSEREGLLRIVCIDRLDRSACGGAHVRSTGEIGPVLIRKLEKVRGNLRIEFLCGGRAVRRSRADYDALSRIAQVFSSPLDEAPSLVAAQQAKLAESEKLRRRLHTEIAKAKGAQLYRETSPNDTGVRLSLRAPASGPVDEALRAEAQSFTANPKAVFVVLTEDPPSALLAVSEDTGIHAGNLMKKALAEAGGRGGGNARIAQGSLPSKEALARLREMIEEAGRRAGTTAG